MIVVFITTTKTVRTTTVTTAITTIVKDPLSLPPPPTSGGRVVGVEVTGSTITERERERERERENSILHAPYTITTLYYVSQQSSMPEYRPKSAGAILAPPHLIVPYTESTMDAAISAILKHCMRRPSQPWMQA